MAKPVKKQTPPAPERADAEQVNRVLEACADEIMEAVQARLKTVRAAYEDRLTSFTATTQTEVQAILERVAAAEAELADMERQRTAVLEQIASLARERDEARALADELQRQYAECRREYAILDRRYGQLVAVDGSTDSAPGGGPAASTGKNGAEAPDITASLSEKFSVYKYLRAAGLEVIDKRPNKGSLWVVGDPAVVKPVLERLQARGIRFQFAAAGGRATEGRPGWHSKTRH